MRISDFDYDLPEELIAQEPLPERDASRLLVLNRATGEISHRRFVDLPSYLTPADLVVLNDSRVIRARLIGKRLTGGSVEVLLLRSLGGNDWETLVRPGRKVPVGTTLIFGGAKGDAQDSVASTVERFGQALPDTLLTGMVLDKTDEGGRVVRFASDIPLDLAIERVGDVPLPPYIKKRVDDPERYQTVYASTPGSVAAPTAGLHFTSRMFDRLREREVSTAFVTLHVGLGTFRPVQVDDVASHKMHEEHYAVTQQVASRIAAARTGGGRVMAVGTTVARTLESSDGKTGEGWTSLFIYPGYQWKVVDMMLTNFHLPRSTLLMMISSLAGKDLVMKAYQEAIRERYRFFSFGDAMLIL